MANASFTRDEVILALDVLYFSGEERLTPNSQAIADLCALLHELPIHPAEGRPENFRNTNGVSKQIAAFKAERQGIFHDSWRIGSIFHKVEDDYQNNHSLLHDIAGCIRRNRSYLRKCSFGENSEEEEFPEGALLSHLHRHIEKRDGENITDIDRCCICQLAVNEFYQTRGSLLQQHLIIPLTDMDAKHRYKPSDFITVCPNCHAALHRYRPWLGKEDYNTIMR